MCLSSGCYEKDDTLDGLYNRNLSLTFLKAVSPTSRCWPVGFLVWDWHLFFVCLFCLFCFVFCFLFFVWLFRATPAACGNSQAMGWIRAAAAGLYHSHSNAVSAVSEPLPSSMTHTTAHGNVRYLTHWARPGIKPAFSWILVGFVNHWATKGTLLLPILYIVVCICQSQTPNLSCHPTFPLWKLWIWFKNIWVSFIFY